MEIIKLMTLTDTEITQLSDQLTEEINDGFEIKTILRKELRAAKREGLKQATKIIKEFAPKNIDEGVHLLLKMHHNLAISEIHNEIEKLK